MAQERLDGGDDDVRLDGSPPSSRIKESAPNIRRMSSIGEQLAERPQVKLETKDAFDLAEPESVEPKMTTGDAQRNGSSSSSNGAKMGTTSQRPEAPQDETGTTTQTDRSNSKSSVPETPGTRIARLRATFESKNAQGESPRFEGAASRAWSVDTDVEVTRLKAALERETELRQEYEEKMTTLQEEIDNLQDTLEQRDAVWRDEWERKSSTLLKEREEASGQLGALEDKMKGSESETSDLQRQLLDLKHSISTSTRTESQVTDSVFAQEMGNLYHEVQNWVVQNFRRANVPAQDARKDMLNRLRKVGEGIRVDGLTAMYEIFDSEAKLVFFQATVMHFLMEVFDEPYLFGLPADGDVRSAAKQFEASATPLAYNKWRSVTFDLIRQSHGTLKDLFGKLIKTSADRIIHDIEVVLSVLTEMQPTESRLVNLKAIVSKSIDIAQRFRVQRAQFEFQLPTPETVFDSRTMEEVFDGSDEALTGKTVACALFPRTIKMGDEQGDNVQLRNVIVKAKVLLKSREPITAKVSSHIASDLDGVLTLPNRPVNWQSTRHLK